jgi:hypothetical protein
MESVYCAIRHGSRESLNKTDYVSSLKGYIQQQIVAVGMTLGLASTGSKTSVRQYNCNTTLEMRCFTAVTSI